VVDQIHARLGERDHFQVLGLSRSATEVEVKQAFAELAKRFHPDLYQSASPELAAKVESIFRRMGEAHGVLSSPEARARYTAGLKAIAPAKSDPAGGRDLTPPAGTPTPAAAPAVAREVSAPLSQTGPEALSAAEGHLAEGRYWEALPILEGMLPQIEGALERRARVLLARVYLMKPESARKAELEYLRLIQLDSSDVESYLALGKFYRERGLAVRARAMLEKVLQIRPAHKGALAEMEAMGSPAPPRTDAATLFGKLLRR
jgi:curved DNA-binding protein CbpA